MRPHPKLTTTATAALLLVLALPRLAAAIELNFSGKIQSDIRFRIDEKKVGGFWNPLALGAGVERNQNLLQLKLTATQGPFTGVVDLDFIWYGYLNDVSGMSDLTRYDKVAPFYVKPHALYLEANDILPGLDVRLGQQLVLWGKGDQFNPTNTINANDIQDPLYFGEQVANLMARVDYNFKEHWSVSGVLVPLFKPAVLPPSAPLGVALNDRLPFTDAALRHRIAAEQAFTGGALKGLAYPTIVNSVTPMMPESSAGNMQWALRIAGVLGEQDIALSYYNGRTDLPQPFLNYTHMQRGSICNQMDRTQCVDGLLLTDTYLGYPKVQVVGLNMAGQIPLGKSTKVKPIGYRLEAGVYFPQAASMILLQDKLDFGITAQPAGEYDYAPGKSSVLNRPNVVDSTPFAKWVLGLDYTFNRYVYTNVMWVHGLADEFGAGDWISKGYAVRQSGVITGPMDTMSCVLGKNGEKCAREMLRPRIGDYLILGFDFKFLDDRGLLRLFTIWDLAGYTEDTWDPVQQARVQTHHSLFSKEGFSAVIYPEFVWNFHNGLEMGAGVLLMLGREYTKFGDPAAGGSLVWTRARYSY